MTAQLLFCAAAAMPRLPPAILVSGRIWQVLPPPSLLTVWYRSQCLMIESKIQRTQTFKPEDPKIVNISKMVYQETPPVQDSGWISGWDSSADVGELLLAPVRPGGAVCPLLQIGLQRGEAQHGPETPQLRDARDAHGKLTFLGKSWRFFNCRIQILASCRCLWRNGRLMTSTEQFVKTLKCTNGVAERGNTIIRMMMIIQIVHLQV